MKALPTEQRDRIKKAFLSSFPEGEQEKALGFLEATGLCPFRGQVKFLSHDVKVKEGNVEKWVKAVSIVTGLDGARAKAAATGRYLPDDQPPQVEYARPGDWHPTRATVRVRIFDEKTKTWQYAYGSCRWDEYAERRTEKKKLAGDEYPRKYPVGDGTLRDHYQSTWGKLAETMLVKCAEVAALRRAFPDELGGVYTEDEMPQAESAQAAAGDDSPFENPLKYECADCKASITPAQASRTIRTGKKNLCETCEAKGQVEEKKPTPLHPPKAEQKPASGEQKNPSGEQPSAPPEQKPAAREPDAIIDPPKADAPPEEKKPEPAAPTGELQPLIATIEAGMAKWPPPRKLAFTNLCATHGWTGELSACTGKQLAAIAGLVETWNAGAKSPGAGKGGAPR